MVKEFTAHSFGEKLENTVVLYSDWSKDEPYTEIFVTAEYENSEYRIHHGSQKEGDFPKAWLQFRGDKANKRVLGSFIEIGLRLLADYQGNIELTLDRAMVARALRNLTDYAVTSGTYFSPVRIHKDKGTLSSRPNKKTAEQQHKPLEQPAEPVQAQQKKGKTYAMPATLGEFVKRRKGGNNNARKQQKLF